MTTTFDLNRVLDPSQMLETVDTEYSDVHISTAVPWPSNFAVLAGPEEIVLKAIGLDGSSIDKWGIMDPLRMMRQLESDS